MSINAISSVSGHHYHPIRKIFDKTEATIEKEFSKLPVEVPRRSRINTLPTLFNANYCVGGTLILSAAPDRNTINHFVTMLLLEQCDIIITLMNPERDEWFDCVSYRECKDIKREQIITLKEGLEMSTLCLGPPEDLRKITHYYYSEWLDGYGADPTYVACLARIALKAKWPLIHCIAGQGRSGTLACVIQAYKMILDGINPSQAIPNALSSLRSERANCIHFSEQYVTVYETVEILLQEDGWRPKTWCTIL